MKVKAKHWINYNGVWHKGGDEFEVSDYEAVKEFADIVQDETVAEYVSEVFPPEKPKRGRPRKQ